MKDNFNSLCIIKKKYFFPTIFLTLNLFLMNYSNSISFIGIQIRVQKNYFLEFKFEFAALLYVQGTIIQ